MTADPTVLTALAGAETTAAEPSANARALAIRWDALQPGDGRRLERRSLVIRLEPAPAAVAGGPRAASLVARIEQAGARPRTVLESGLAEVRTARTGGGVHADVRGPAGELLLAVSLAEDGRLLFARSPLLERAGFGPGATFPPRLAAAADDG